MNVKTIGIDLAKAIFQIHGVNEHGKCLFNKQLKRAQMISFFANLPPLHIPADHEHRFRFNVNTISGPM